MPTKTTTKTTTRKPPICDATNHPTLSGSGPWLSTTPEPTDRFASVEQQEQFLWRASLSSEDTNDNPSKERPSAHIEEIIEKDLDPSDDSGPDEPPQDKGKGGAEGECPHNNPPDGGDDRDDGNDPDDSDDDSDGSDACHIQLVRTPPSGGIRLQ